MSATSIDEGVVFFAFESDFVATLLCVPMIVRFKLDLCGVKLSLKGWSRFDHDTRFRCAHLPMTNAQRSIATESFSARPSRRSGWRWCCSPRNLPLLGARGTGCRRSSWRKERNWGCAAIASQCGAG
ncbi:conserved hypothetical protein [Paracidovorax cattleyae]|uniref:Uncharacterized protein n=1 Tax=Paracidovorax cattleyae TaxID=80868 RepID=A0A1H0WRM7_9BURK|nr:hypothetical protein [Paracidovorax cattleyae]SDP93302.1 conserved hypothetical protein [Paracidovorax cattleyae]